MKVRIEIDKSIEEDEIVISCGQMTDQIEEIRQKIIDIYAPTAEIVFYKAGEEYYFPIKDVIFFETGDEQVYAHTKDDAYRIKLRLYELLNILPRSFVRVSKSTIINIDHVQSIDRNLASSSLVRFHKTHKQVYVSRFYYKALKQRLV